MKQIQQLVIALALLFGLQSAHADLIDQGDMVLDTDNNLLWLDVSVTDGMSFNDALATYAADGWTYATESQYEAMFDSYFTTYDDSNNDGAQSVYPGDPLYDQALVFRAMFGSTYDTSTNASASYGFYVGNDNILHVGGVFFGSDLSFSNLYRDNTGNFDANRTAGHANIGVYLVRAATVPEASTLAMFAIGLLGLGFARRKHS